jgi:hypothetical protein
VWDYLVLLLLVSPVEPPVPRQAPEPLWEALKRVSLMLEIVGPHERWRSDFQAELRYVRYHWRELLDAPPWTDSLRLPPAGVAADCCCWNLAYQEYARNRRWMCRHRWDEYTVCLEEARQLYLVWKTVLEAADVSNSWVHQRRGLRKLRELIGPEAYATGTLPPAAPVWRFEFLEAP